MGPPTMPPITAPVMPPAVCFETSGRFFSAFFLAMMVFLGRLETVDKQLNLLAKHMSRVAYHTGCGPVVHPIFQEAVSKPTRACVGGAGLQGSPGSMFTGASA